MSFNKSLLRILLFILPLCIMVGCESLHKTDNVNYYQVVKSLEIGPYEFVNESSVEIISRVFNDSNAELRRAGYSRGIGITVGTDDKDFSGKLYSISVRRNTICTVLESIAHEMGCSVAYKSGVFHLKESK